MYRFVPLCLLLAAGLLCAAGPYVPPTVTAEDAALIAAAKKGSTIKSNLLYLSDEIGPRLTGSEALNRACNWAADKLRSYGVENVRLEPYTIPEGWERGHAHARLVEPNNGVRIALESSGWRGGTDGKIVGDVIALTGDNIRDQYKELTKLKGKLKWAIILSGPPSKVRSLEDVNKSASPSYARPAKGPRITYEEMKAIAKDRDALLAREGVAALLQDSGKPLNLVVTTGGWRGKDRPSALNKMPILFVGHDSYSMLHRLGTRPAPAKTRLELDVSNKFIPGPVKVFNVIGEIRGREKPDEYVVIGAHLDSWDLGQGTTDNGTGTCVVLEAARLIAASGQAPKRTIRFCLFTGEEQGLIGSRAFVEKHKADMPRTSAAIVHDVGTGRIKGLGVGGRPAAALLERELSALRTLGVTDFTTRSYPGSDHAAFDAVGVPGLMAVQAPAYYFLSHHTAADTPERILEDDLIQGAAVMAVSAVRIANLEKLLPRPQGKGPTRPVAGRRP